MAKCLVLGANGFIGSHLVDSLVAGGHQVRAFGRFKGESLFQNNELVDLYIGDFLNKSDLVEALKGIEYVFHFISTTTPASAENDPMIDIETNMRMSIELLQSCVDENIKRVLFASTGGSIYGESTGKPFSEVDTPWPVSPYAIGKLTIEHYLHYFKVKHGLDSVSLRISNPYGERQPLHRKQGVIPIFLDNIINDREITVFGDGSMVRDYIYVKDVAEMITSMFQNTLIHGVYNIGSGKGSTLKELLKEIETITDKQVKVSYVNTPTTYVHEVILNTDRFLEEFGQAPTTSLRDGLIKTYDYIDNEMRK